MVEVVKLYRVSGDSPIKAFADIMVGNSFIVKGIRIVEGKNGLFVRMPTKAAKDGRWYEIVSPISSEIRAELSSFLLEAYSE